MRRVTLPEGGMPNLFEEFRAVVGVLKRLRGSPQDMADIALLESRD